MVVCYATSISFSSIQSLIEFMNPLIISLFPTVELSMDESEVKARDRKAYSGNLTNQTIDSECGATRNC